MRQVIVLVGDAGRTFVQEYTLTHTWNPLYNFRQGELMTNKKYRNAINTIIIGCCLSVFPTYGDADQEFSKYLSKVVSSQVQLNEQQEENILQKLISYPTSLPGLVSSDEKEVERDLSLLCDFRECLTKQGYDYDRFLISQLIDRIAFVSLSQCMISAGRVSPKIKRLCKRVSAVTYDPESLESVFGSTTKPSIDAVRVRLKELKSPEFPNMDLTELSKLELENLEKTKRYYRLLMISTESETWEEAFYQGGRSSDWNELFAKKDVTSLLSLLWRTDSLVHVALPALELYIENCCDFSIKDDSNKIAAVFDNLDMEEVRPSSYLNNESFNISVSSILRRVREGRLFETAGLRVAQKIINPKPDPELMIEKSLFGIESAKSQMKMSNPLKDGDVISLEKVEAFLRRQVFIPEDGGEYQVGVIGLPAKFTYPDGRIIYGKVIENISMETLRKRQEERLAKMTEEMTKEARSKGLEVIVVPPPAD